MQSMLGHYKNSIARLKLEERYLYQNTLILGEEGVGKTHLASKIRNYVIANDIPTLYLDFSDPEVGAIEERYKDEHFNYIRFEESDAFDAAFEALIAARKHIYMAVNPNYFATKRDIKSRLTHTIQKRELLDNYYYFFHEIACLNAFYTRFEDFLLYMLGLLNLKKYGFTLLSQPHETFEDPKLKLLFTFLFVGRCSNADYFNTSDLKNLPRNHYLHQMRMDNKSLLFNMIKTDLVIIDA